jgi:hypothetical protein
MSNFSKSWRNIIGEEGFSEGIHYWQFHIIDSGLPGGIMIGVSSGKKLSLVPGIDGDDGCTYHNNGMCYPNKNEKKCAFSYFDKHDDIGVLLNMEEKTISFFKNGNLLGCGAGADVLVADRYYPVISIDKNFGRCVGSTSIEGLDKKYI